jgi:hypothetical protein
VKELVPETEGVCLYIITRVLFIGCNEGSERTKVIELHPLVEVIGKRKRYEHLLSLIIHNSVHLEPPFFPFFFNIKPTQKIIPITLPNYSFKK